MPQAAMQAMIKIAILLRYSWPWWVFDTVYLL